MTSPVPVTQKFVQSYPAVFRCDRAPHWRDWMTTPMARSRYSVPWVLRGPADVLSGIETTVQRIAELSFSGSMTVNTCVPSGSSGFLDIDRDIKQRREALTHEPAQLSTHENGYWDDFLRRSSRWSRARSLGLGSFLHADIGYQSRLRCRGCFIAVNRAAIARLSGEPDAVFGFETKRCELVISIGTTSWRAMMTRVPRFGRCQSRHRYY